MTIYISGPMTGIAGNNFPAFHAAAEHLRGEGFEVCNPAKTDNLVTSGLWEDYLRADLIDMLRCDAIYMLPGWESSKGALLEWYVARQLKMEVIYQPVIGPGN